MGNFCTLGVSVGLWHLEFLGEKVEILKIGYSGGDSKVCNRKSLKGAWFTVGYLT